MVLCAISPVLLPVTSFLWCILWLWGGCEGEDSYETYLKTLALCFTVGH